PCSRATRCAGVAPDSSSEVMPTAPRYARAGSRGVVCFALSNPGFAPGTPGHATGHRLTTSLTPQGLGDQPGVVPEQLLVRGGPGRAADGVEHHDRDAGGLGDDLCGAARELPLVEDHPRAGAPYRGHGLGHVPGAR